MSDLEKRTLVELRKMAKELGIPAISGLKKRELIEKIEQSSEVQKNDSVPRSAASDFSHRNFDEKTEAPQEHTEREKQFFEELGEGILEVLQEKAKRSAVWFMCRRSMEMRRILRFIARISRI